MSLHTQPAYPLSLRRIFSLWWPLAASWILMGAELPAVSAIVARLPNPEIHLAAYGGVVFPLALIIESPVIMLLAASTALSKDWDTYAKIRRIMHTMGVVLTALHILVAFTPLYDFVAGRMIGAPAEILEPARLGLRIMTPWTWSIAFRRFNQGVLIRFKHSRMVSIGTVIRLIADATVLAAGYLLGSAPGIVVATAAVIAGVVSEAFYIGLAVRPVIRNELRPVPAPAEPLTFGAFTNFYLPLVMTSLLTLISQPIGSAAISRMPMALASLAVWPVMSGLVFIFRSVGMAYNEVVIAMLDEMGSYASLRRFTGLLAVLTSGVLTILAATPLAYLWFAQVSALSPALVELARQAIWWALPLPALAALQSWYQGAILYGRRTRGVTEAVIVYLVCITTLQWAGVLWGQIAGIFVGLGAMALSMAVQTAWLLRRSRPVLSIVQSRDLSAVQVQAAGSPAD